MRFYLFLLPALAVIGFLYQSRSPQATPSEPDTLICGTDELNRQLSDQLTARQDSLERAYQDWARAKHQQTNELQERSGHPTELRGRTPISGANTLQNQIPPPYELPIVFHILHDNGAENISDARIQTSLDQLNASMANTGYYDQGTGVNTQIQFCLAERTPDNQPTNGITRQVTNLTNVDADTEDLALKDLARWNTRDYVNVYVVREICGLGFGCGVAGYAYYPGAHGGSRDGIVVEARWLGDDEADNAVLTHEIGHYLGLRHTFNGGCTNDDCLSDGDAVCDTPPDNSTAAVPCSGSANTCTTDTDSGFATDQPDMHINYMDYGYFSCYSALTAGQRDRMHFFIEGIRSSLLESYGCRQPCPELVMADFNGEPGGDLIVGDAINLNSTSTGTNTNSWFIDGVFQTTGDNFSFTFNSPGTYLVTMRSTSSVPVLCASDEKTIVVRVVCPYAADITTGNQYPVEFTMVTYSTTDNAPFYEWTVDGTVVSNAAGFDYTFPGSGIYELCLRKGMDACEQTVCQTIFVTNSYQPCSGETFAQYIQWEVTSDQSVGFGAYRAVLQDGGDLALAGINAGSIHLAKVTALGQPIWSRRIRVPGSSLITFTEMHFLVDDDGRYLVYCASGGINNSGHLLIKYDPLNDQVDFSQSYNYVTETSSPLHLSQRPNTDEYLLINRRENGSVDDWKIDLFGVERATGNHNIPNLNRSWEVIDTAVYVNDARWHDDRLYTVATLDTTGESTIVNESGLQVFDQDGELLWARRLPSGGFGLDDLTGNLIWVDDDGILLVSGFANGAAGLRGQLFSKFDLNGQLEWQRPYQIHSSGGRVISLRPFLGGYLGMVLFDLQSSGNAQLGLVYLDDMGNLVWSRRYGDDYSALNFGRQSLFTAGNYIFMVGGKLSHSAPGSGVVNSFLYRLDEFGFFQDECVPISDLAITPLQVQGSWEDYNPLEGALTISDGNRDVVLENESYLPNNTCNSPCFEICGNGIDDDFNGETDCEDAALAETCCCLDGPEPPVIPDTTLCPGEVWTVIAPAIDSASILWSTGSTERSITIDSAADYSLMITDSCGRDTTVFFSVDYLPPSAPPDLGPDQLVCANGLTELDAGPGWASYRWFDLSSGQTATAWGAGDFWVEVTDSCGQIFGDTLTVTVLPGTELDLGPPDSSIVCGTDSITLSAPTGYSRYQWLPAGPLSCDDCPSVRVAVPPAGDSLTVYALGYTEDGCAAGDSIRIWTSAGQGQNLVAEFCAGAGYVFGDTTLTAAGQYFLPNDCGAIDTLNLTEIAPVATSSILTVCPDEVVEIGGQPYSAPSLVNDTLTASNGCDSIHTTELVRLFETDLESNTFDLCRGDSMLISGQWYVAPTTVFDTLVSATGSECIRVVNLDVFLNPLTREEQTICPGDSAFIIGEWQTEPGVYTDTLVSAVGCDSLYEVTLLLDLAPSFTWSVEPQCESELVIVTILPTAGPEPFTVNWEVDPTLPPLMGLSQQLAPGTYPVDVRDANGCPVAQDVVVPFFPPIEYELNTVFDRCLPDGIAEVGYLSISDISQLTEISINGDIQTPADSIPLAVDTRYEISISDQQGCVRDTIIIPSFLDGLTVSLPPTVSIELGDSVLLMPQVSGGTGVLTYVWSPVTSLDCENCPAPFASPSVTTEYTLQVTDATGCFGEATVLIEVAAPEFSVFVPTAFSPNEDGVNDRLFPGLPPAVVQIQRFEIYDRWGGRLYAVEDVSPNEGSRWGWNGESRGRPVGVGVYVWTLEVLLADGRTMPFAGEVALIR